jgi:hypothetical protein
MDKADKIIAIIRHLKEEGMAVGTGGFSGSSDPKGPVAGYDKVLDGRSKIMRRLPSPYRESLQKNRKR